MKYVWNLPTNNLESKGVGESLDLKKLTERIFIEAR